MQITIQVLCLVALFAASFQLVHPYSHYLEATDDATFPAKWVDMQLDHYDPTVTDTFKNRYYINDQYYDKSKGLVFLSFGEEAPLNGPPSGGDEVAVLAKKHGALIVALEHRYYGETQPRPDWSTPNLRWLTPEQALEDLAEFVKFIDEQLHGPGFDGIPRDRWVAFGGSYSGAMSCWMRLKYPHLIHAALSSSGVINAINEFTAFDLQIQATANNYSTTCLDAVIHTREAIERAMAKDTKATLNKYHAPTNMRMFDFFYFVADAMSLPFQYGHSSTICDPLVDAAPKGDEALMDAFYEYIMTWFNPVMNPAGAMYYDGNYLAGSKIDTSSSQKQWWFEKCSRLAYFQVAPAGRSIRSPTYVTLDGHHDFCNRVYGNHLEPHTDRTQDHYGGEHPHAHRVFFSNGGSDPWRHAAVEKTLSADQPAMTAWCRDCGHCGDMKKALPTDPPQLTAQRASIARYMAEWINMPRE
ncbi:Peptidase S28 [Carpediemonas membranifera]|uniref:Peptidase S28 n=1 Tax=Carpediemonas membranifera TaxID=201153 RepID=A0A8J6B6F5_9EUKA|nr:Peptidase S28 [Carpediemonas membranifera]|eukprot:KAG9390972.1 Peptidase S28 [Carpediemonas membranifera]